MRTLFSLICLGGAVALFILYTKPTYDGLKTVQTSIGQYDLALDKANELQRRKQELLSRYNTFSPTDLDRLHKLLPNHVDNVRLILDVDSLATKHGLALQSVVIASQAASSDASQKAVIGPSQKQYDSLTLSFSTAATYPQFVTLLTDIERSLRIVDVVKLTMAVAPVGEGSTSEPMYRFDITVRTYWLK